MPVETQSRHNSQSSPRRRHTTSCTATCPGPPRAEGKPLGGLSKKQAAKTQGRSLGSLCLDSQPTSALLPRHHSPGEPDNPRRRLQGGNDVQDAATAQPETSFGLSPGIWDGDGYGRPQRCLEGEKAMHARTLTAVVGDPTKGFPRTRDMPPAPRQHRNWQQKLQIGHNQRGGVSRGGEPDLQIWSGRRPRHDHHPPDPRRPSS